MPWYNAGTVAVTNNNATVNGTGTAWADNIDAGQAFVGPDGLAYEILSVVSATQITLASNYKGATAAGQSYRIMPVQGYLRDLAAQAASLVLSFATVRDGIGQGKFPDGTMGTPGIRFAGDEDTGFYRPSANVLAGVIGGAEGWRLNSTGFGIGTNNPLWKFHVSGAASDLAGIISSGTTSGLLIGDSTAAIRLGTRSGAFIVDVGVERLRISTAGNVGIGVNGDAAEALHIARAGWCLQQLQNSAGIMKLGVINGTGDVVVEATTAGKNILFNTVGSTRFLVESGGHFRPASDNLYNVGAPSFRVANYYGANSAIVTSDARAKQDITPIPDEWLDAWGAVDWKRYKFIDAVQAKGDDARWHLGLVAQAVRDAFAASNLDAHAIGLLCYDEWEEQREPIFEEQQTGTETVIIGHEDTGLLNAQGQPIIRTLTEERPVMGMVDTGETRVTLEAGDRWGLRYDECQAMEAAWQRRELARKGDLVAALTARIEALEAAA